MADNDQGSGGRPTKHPAKHLTKQEFGQRLYNLMLARGWKQSELARQAGLNRDSVSTYVNGRSLPTPQSLRALARALDMTSEELLPNHTISAIEADVPAFEMKASAADPTKVFMRIDRLVTMATAVEILKLLQADSSTTDGT